MQFIRKHIVSTFDPKLAHPGARLSGKFPNTTQPRAPPSTSPTPGSVQSPRSAPEPPPGSPASTPALSRCSPVSPAASTSAPSPPLPGTAAPAASPAARRSPAAPMPPPAAIASPIPPVSPPLGRWAISAPLHSSTIPCSPLPLFLGGHLSFAQKGTLPLCANSHSCRVDLCFPSG